MSDRWEERKEQLATFRTEYSLLFPDLHFFQGLRFAVLGATLPLEAGLFTVYRTALPIVQKGGTMTKSKRNWSSWLMCAIGVSLAVLTIYPYL